MSTQKKFLDIFDDFFMFSGEMVENAGEDNYYGAHDEKSLLLGVFDGCGGLGAKNYPTFRYNTGAYMASRIVSGAVHDWYHDNHATVWTDGELLADSINQYIKKGYAICDSRAKGNSRIRGSMVRDFPTTCAMALAQLGTDCVNVFCMWAGDSRVYLMDEYGLAQISEDDVEGEDAMSNLYHDGALTNVLSSDGNYVIHYKLIQITRPTLIFAATDGCFGYVPSPMEFEYMILRTLAESTKPSLFHEALKNQIKKYASDDYALGMAGMYFGDFETMKHYFENRIKYLENYYINPIENGADRNELWLSYKAYYERYCQ